jgi:hypothetical protein
MKKLMSLMVGLAFVLGTVSFAQEAPKKDEATKTEKKKASKKKKAEKKTEEKKQG